MEKKQSYDSEHDILYINRGEKVKESLEIGDMVVDLSYDGKVAGLEILNASKTISELTGIQVSDNNLRNIEKADLDTVKKGEHLFIVLKIAFRKEEKLIEKSIDVNLPSREIATI
ncbi:MAG: DUF2283 domain-containing protein [Candidatus Nanohaloarchaea archaeon]|nr:DUF2283 domain-containing protein [Candidatus Nanohaloarchaea archaeon]